MRLRATNIRTHITDGGEQEIVLTLKGRAEVVPLKDAVENGKLLSVEIKQHRDRRSLDANAYCWVLVQKIAESIQQVPDNVYRKFIRDVGQCQYMPVKNEAVDKFIEIWGERGIGWFAEKAWDTKGIPGYTTVKAYYGSSCYDTKEMSVLIDEIVRECKEMGIDTATPAEIELMKSRWGELNKS